MNLRYLDLTANIVYAVMSYVSVPAVIQEAINIGHFNVDRVKNQHGYTKDNIAVISWRANRLKQAMTALEARQLAAYMENHVHSV